MKTFVDAQIKHAPSNVKPRRAGRAINPPVTCAVIAFVGFLASIACAVPSFAQIVGTVQLNIERRGHTATLLEDGKVLIVGGDNQSGIVNQVELLDPASQTSSLAAMPIVARTDHAAIKLDDGRVLIIGGHDRNGSLTSTEIYNPLTAKFTAGPSLTTPRSGHSATVLANGNILVAGGDASGSAELYNPTTQSFSLIAGSMNTARKFQSAILLNNGQVLIAGGVGAQNNVLNTAEVYDPSSQSFYVPPTDMQTPRALAMLKLLSDGKVQIIGGDAELSMEVFDPTNGIFIAKALLPPNAVLLGATLSTQSRAALFSPTISQDPLLQGVLTPEQLALLDRADHSITELPSRNQALVAGGINSAGQTFNSATLVSSSSASVTTDKTDYSPGQIVTITGSGFQPNEQVDIYFHEFPEEYPDIFLSAVANQQGNFVTAEFAPQQIDLGRIFTLTAIGQSSSFTAQTAFKDAGDNTSVSVTCSPGSVSSGSPTTCTAQVNNTQSGAPAGWPQGTVVFSAIGGLSGSFSPSATCSLVQIGSTNNSSCSVSFTPSGATSGKIKGDYNPLSANWKNGNAQFDLTVIAAQVATTTAVISSVNPSVFGQSLTFTATVSRASGSGAPVGSVQFKVDGVNLGTAVTLTGVNTTSASATSVATTTLAVGTRVITAEYTPGTGFSASTGTLMGGQVVNKATPTATLVVSNSPQTYNGSPKAATVVISVSSVAGAVANVLTGGAATQTAAATYAVTADFVPTDSANYNTLTGLSAGNFVINKAPVTATAGGGTGTYNGLTQSPSACAVTGAYTGDLTCANNPASVGPDFGTTTIVPVVSGTGLANFEVTPINGSYTINKAPVTATAGGGTGTYNGSTQSPSACAVTGAYTGDLTCANNPASVGPDFGTTTIVPVVSGTGLANFEVTPINGSYTINKAPVTATAGGGTGTYNGLTQSPSACAVTGAYTGDLTCANNPASVGPDFGTTTIVPVVSGTGLANFEVTPINGSYTINKAPVTATAGGGTGTYNGLTQSPSACAVTGAYTGDLTCANNPASVGPDFGTTTIVPVVSGTGLANFEVTPINGSYTINKAPVTATAGGGTGTYNGLTQSPSACAVTGAYTGDLTCANNPASVGPDFGTTTIVPVVSGTGLANFEVTPINGSYTINKAPVTATAGGGTGTYNGSTQSPSACAVTGAYTGSLSCLNTPALVGPDANTYTITPNVIGDTTNFLVTLTNGSYKIDKATSTTTVTGGTFTYDGNPHPATVSITGAGGLNLTPAPSYSGGCSAAPVYVNQTTPIHCTASYTYVGDDNHTGSSGSDTITITTAFVFNGFYSPIGGSVEKYTGGTFVDPIRAFKLGSTIPVKFGATWLNGGAPLITGIHTLQAVKYSNATDSDAPIDATPTDAATTGNQFRLTSPDWHFNLSTKGFSAGTWLLIATLEDGSRHTVWISIKK